MTIEQLIERLKDYPQDAEVLLLDVETLELVTITGFMYSPMKNEIELSNLEHATITEIIRTTEYQLLQIGIKK